MSTVLAYSFLIFRVLAWQVREVAMEAIERARRGEGPTLIEAQTYRFRGHSLADPDELREKKEKEYWQVLSHTLTDISRFLPDFAEVSLAYPMAFVLSTRPVQARRMFWWGPAVMSLYYVQQGSIHNLKHKYTIMLPSYSRTIKPGKRASRVV